MTGSSSSSHGGFGESANSHQSSGHGDSVMPESLMGALYHINVVEGTSCFIILICSIVFVEGLFHYLHEKTQESAFHELVIAIEKELFIVGALTFVLKLIVNLSTSLNEQFFLGIEFSDIVLPINAVVYLTVGLILSIVSKGQSREWSKAYHLKTRDIEKEQEENYKRLGHTLSRSRWFVFSTPVVMMEFKIFSRVFFDEYNIRSNAFDFDEYCDRFCQIFILNIVTISPLNWAIIIVFLLLNLGRVRLGIELYTCEEGDLECFNERSLIMVTFFGWLLTFLALFMFILSRIYELRVLSTHGVQTIDDYGEYLEHWEQRQYHDSIVGADDDAKKLTSDDLKVAAINAKKKKEHDNEVFWERIQRFVTKMTTRPFDYMKYLITGQSDIELEEAKKSLRGHARSTIRSAPVIASLPTARKRGHQALDGSQPLSGPNLGRPQNYADNLSRQLEASMTMSEEYSSKLSNAFFLRNPSLYFQAFDILLMPIAFYAAFWLVNFSISCKHTKSGRTAMWYVLSALPLVLSILLYVLAFKSASLLRCVSSLDGEIVLQVLEASETAHALGVSVREKILSRLNAIGDPEVQLRSLFRDIDEDGSNMLSRTEFQQFLRNLKINFSKKRWKQIFNEIDRNYDDNISFEELFFFIFPKEANAKRVKKLKSVSGKVMSKIISQVKTKHYEEATTDLEKQRTAAEILFGSHMTTKPSAGKVGGGKGALMNAISALKRTNSISVTSTITSLTSEGDNDEEKSNTALKQQQQTSGTTDVLEDFDE